MWRWMIVRILFPVLYGIGSGLCVMADEHPLTLKQREEITAKYTTILQQTTEQLEKNPKEVELLSRRGDAHFFLGHFPDAVADYDAMVQNDNELDSSHWRRGIAWFYAKNYKAAAGQFERYHSFDDVDRENGIWRFFSQYKAEGAEVAQKGLLKYRKDDRQPFPAVYRMFSGELKPVEVLKVVEEGEVSAEERQKRRFYAELYVGLNLAIHDQPEAAVPHLRASTANPWPQTAGYGPHYMWHVGRLHYDLLNKPR